jgi:ribosomal protein L29
MKNSLNLLENLEHIIEDDSNDHYQVDSPINFLEENDTSSSAIYKLLLDCSERIDQQQENTGYLLQGSVEILAALEQQSTPDSSAAIADGASDAIESINQDLQAMAKVMMNVHQYLKQSNLSQNLTSLKAEQQSLRKALETGQRKNNNLVYLDWKQIATIITATAIVSSLCSFAIFQVTSNNMKADQPTTPTEKLLKPKKTSR